MWTKQSWPFREYNQAFVPQMLLPAAGDVENLTELGTSKETAPDGAQSALLFPDTTANIT